MQRGLSLIFLGAALLLSACQTNPLARERRANIQKSLDAFQHSINARSFAALQPRLADEVKISDMPAEMSLAGLKAGMHWTTTKVDEIQVLSLAKTTGGSEAKVALYMGNSILSLRMGFDAAGKITSIDSNPLWKTPATAVPDSFTSEFVQQGQLMFVRAKVNGKSGFFLFDTGASQLLLNNKYFTSESGQGMAGISATVTGLKKNLGRAKVNSLEWGGLRRKETFGQLHDLSRMERPAITPLLGAISHDEVKDCAVTIDWHRKTIQLFATRSNGTKKAKTPQPPNGIKIPFTYSTYLPLIEARIGEKTYPLLFDSGAESNVLPSTEGLGTHFRQLGMITVSDGARKQPYPTAAGLVDETILHGVAFRNLPFVIHATPYMTDKGFLGTPLLEAVQLMEINFPAKTITFWR